MWIMLGVVVTLSAWYFWELSHRRTRAMSAGLHADISLPHEQTWELYHNNFSLCSKKIRVCLAELGIDYKPHHVDLIETGAYENISREFLAVNPAALVPVLVHHGHPIYESHEQLAYAAAHAGQADLLVPRDPAQRATMDHWVHKSSLLGDDPIAGMHETAGNAVPGLTLPIFAAMIAHIPLHRILTGLLFHRFKRRALLFLMLKVRGVDKLPGMTPMVKVIRRSREAMHEHMNELETDLETSGGPWIVGSQFTLADVGMMVILERLREVDWLDEFVSDKRPRVAAYWQELQARPSYRTGIAAFSHPTVDRGTADIVALKNSDPDFRAALLGSMT